MIRVGLTGGIATGKATVAAMFARLGAFVVDADQLAREAVRPGAPAWSKVIEAFGKDILKADGCIDRKKLAEIVFNDPGKLKLLNSIVHPPVITEMKNRLDMAEREGSYSVAVANVPLLFEAGLEREFDKTIVVACPREEQIRRCCDRDNLSRKEVENRIRMQMPLESKIKRSDFVIHNIGALEDIERHVSDIWKKLTGG